MEDEATRDSRQRLARVGDPVALLAGLFAHAPVGFQIYQADGRCLLVNQAFLELFGSEPPPEYNVLEDEIAARAGVLPMIQRAFTGETIRVPTVWYDPRELTQVKVAVGRRVAIQATFFPLHDASGRVAHVAIAFKDVTEETSRQELLEAIVQQSGDGIIVADREGVLRIFNRAAEEQHGVARTNIPAADWTSTFGLRTLDGGEMAMEEAPLYRALKGERVEDARWIVRRPDGSTRVLSGTATPLRHADASPAGAVIITRDETERVAVDERLRRAAEERERIMGVLGHDLRSPLAAIGMAADMLLRSGLSLKQGELMTQLVRSVDRMRRMIGELLDFTRVRALGGLTLQRKVVVGLREIVDDIVAEMRVANPERRIDFVDEAGDAGTAELDRDRVAQAAANLIGNALEHGAPGAPVTITLDSDGERVRLRVHNAGPPIATPLLEQLFEPFARGADASSTGLGLGLFIVKQIVAAHGGKITVATDPAKGTTFTIELPRARH